MTLLSDTIVWDRALHPYLGTTPVPSPDPTLVYGVELEVENVNPWPQPVGFTQHEDGSLRNGVEFVSVPMTYSGLHECLYGFEELADFTLEKNYSERCSVHVHTNVRDLTFDTLGCIALLYQVFERCLFQYHGIERQKNIFCVPWHDTRLTSSVIFKIAKGDCTPFRRWQKYTALNLIPVATQGTIEWRQMRGTNDIKAILEWCRIIGHIYRFARETTYAELRQRIYSLNTTSAYHAMVFDVFRDEAQIFLNGVYEQLLEDGVINVKYASIEHPTADVKIPPPDILGLWAAEQQINAPRRGEMPPQRGIRRMADLRWEPIQAGDPEGVQMPEVVEGEGGF